MKHTEHKEFLPDKSRMKGNSGGAITENLFLEMHGNRETAQYSLKDDGHEENGVVYPSIKKLYLENVSSPYEGEYEFANKYFLGWKHWQRICKNKKLVRRIDEWREELEVKIRSQGIRSVIESANAGSYQAAKWVAEGNFVKKRAGRPSNEELEASLAKDKRLMDEYSEDVVRLNAHL